MLRETAFGGIDVLVNNAGIMMLSSLADADDANFDRQVSRQPEGHIQHASGSRVSACATAAAIINLSTSVVGVKLETYGVYAATKAAVETLTAIMSKEMRGRNITVNAVAPGPTATDLFLNGKSDELVARMAKMNPLERLGRPQDIAAAVAFLAGPDGCLDQRTGPARQWRHGLIPWHCSRLSGGIVPFF